MDIRVKTFAAAVERRFGFLVVNYGFNGPELIGAGDEYPLVRTLRYSRGGLGAEISLVLTYMGEEYISTVITRDDPPGLRRDEIGHDTAHTGYQMRRALDRRSEAVLPLISQIDPDGGCAELPIVCASTDPAMKELISTHGG